ncbi:MAG: geranylgeranyl reductase family protein [Acidobacteriota bacterium]
MTFDAAVVGAGPAGSWTARSLARAGARVLLLDPSHPREKPCGGGITGRALDLVADAIAPRDLPFVSIRSARFTSSSSPDACDVPLEGGALVVTGRCDFDTLLLEAARHCGASVLEARVTSVRPARGGFEIETTAGVHRAARLVGADGANSLVRRRLGAMFRRDQLSIATGFFAHGVTSDQIAIEFVSDPPGYIWSFPRPGHLAIGICAQADAGASAAHLRQLAARWIERTRIAHGARLEAYSWPIPSLPAADFERLHPAGRGWLLVGDAAGLVDPITREGIYFALRSAEWAADAIGSSEPEPWRRYAERVREEIGADLASAARLKRRFFRPRFTRLMIDALRHSAAIRTVMGDLVCGRQGYSDLKWRLLKTLQLGVAARFFFGQACQGMTTRPDGD